MLNVRWKKLLAGIVGLALALVVSLGMGGSQTASFSLDGVPIASGAGNQNGGGG